MERLKSLSISFRQTFGSEPPNPRNKFDSDYHITLNKLIESAQHAKDTILAVIPSTIGTPFFDSIPQVLSVSDKKVEIKLILVVPKEWYKNRGLKSKIEKIQKLARKRGKAEIKLIDEETYYRIILNNPSNQDQQS